MNFFAHQDRAQRSTRLLVGLFVLAVILITIGVNALMAAVFAAGDDAFAPGGSFVAWAGDNWPLFVWTTLAVVITIAGGSGYRIASLSDGGGAVARSLGGTQVAAHPEDAQHRRLRNVVEEISIASGLPVPEIYVLEKEASINAFAAGYSPADAAVAVSQGSLDQLNRDELQGVIAHEFSHIANGDMRLNLRLMGILFGILVIGLAGRQLLRVTARGRISSRKEGGGIVVIALALTILGYTGLFIGQIIKAAVSRQRELLADASAVQFTRHPAGLAGALKKIAGLGVGSKIESSKAEEASHFFFAEGVSHFLLATHPPLAERIKAIDPHFDESQLKNLPRNEGRELPELAAGFSAQSATIDEQELSVSTNEVLDNIGQPESRHIAYAAKIRSGLPDALVNAARDLDDAVNLVLAMLLDDEEPTRSAQVQAVRRDLGDAAASRLLDLRSQLDELNDFQRLPLAELAFPALKRRPPSYVKTLLTLMQSLIEADDEITVFEYAVARMLMVYLEQSVAPSRGRESRRRLSRLEAECATLLSLIAHFGTESPMEARRAYAAGMNELFANAFPPFTVPGDWVDDLDRALARLDRLPPLSKEQLVRALTAAVAHDGRVTVSQAELLRAVCSVVHCPMPPLLDVANPDVDG